MRLLLVHQHLGALGGAEANLYLTATELQRRGHVLGLLYHDRTGRKERAWRLAFSECIPLPATRAGEAAHAALNSFGPDLLYLHNLPDLEVLQVLTHSGVPAVRLVHDHTLYCLRGYKYNYFTRHICTRAASGHCVFPCLATFARSRTGPWPFRWASFAAKRREIQLHQHCHALVVFSEYMRQELLRNGFEAGRIHVLPPVFDEGGPAPLRTLSERNLVLFAGQILRGKGVDVLLRALARVQAPFECVIAGEGHHRRSCERLCRRLGLSERVRFVGFLSPAELEACYREASVLAFSSVWPEPFGLAGLEAMRYGLPVVAFDVGGVREWLHDGENGFLVPWMDTAMFAARLDELLSNKDLARSLGRRGYELVAHDYARARGADALEMLFLRLLRDSQGQAPTKPNPWLRTPVSAYD